MFDDLIKEIKKLEKGLTVSIPIASDEKGYVDKECPREDCMFVFKVSDEDWANIFKDEAVYCPLCREEAPSDHWWTTEQLEQARKQTRAIGLSEIQNRVSTALHKSAKAFNRKQPRNAFVNISMSVSSRKARVPVAVPLAACEEMEQEIQCSECSARFAVIGAAYFCPACGHNSVERTFDDSLRKVEGKLNNIETIRNALLEEGLKDEAETTCRSLVESCMSDCVVAFQRLAEQLYISLPASPKMPPKNVFQRLSQGSDLWRTAIGKGYEDWLTKDELEDMNLLFQRRHLLAHTEGIVDQDYFTRSGDKSYKLGQRIVVREKDVKRLLYLVRNLADSLRIARDSYLST